MDAADFAGFRSTIGPQPPAMCLRRAHFGSIHVAERLIFRPQVREPRALQWTRMLFEECCRPNRDGWIMRNTRPDPRRRRKCTAWHSVTLCARRRGGWSCKKKNSHVKVECWWTSGASGASAWASLPIWLGTRVSGTAQPRGGKPIRRYVGSSHQDRTALIGSKARRWVATQPMLARHRQRLTKIKWLLF
jgi:hypothetical protein